MYASLPESLKQQVLRYLSVDNFQAAKEIYDAWLAKQTNQQPHEEALAI